MIENNSMMYKQYIKVEGNNGLQENAYRNNVVMPLKERNHL